MKYFKVQEFIDPITYKELGDNSISLIDSKLIDIADFIREDIGLPVTINNWHENGQYKESGLRNKNSKTGAPKSTHKLGKGMDLKIKGWGGKEWYEYVKEKFKKLYDLGLRRIEDKSIATTWCHMDTKEHKLKNTIQVVDKVKVTELIK
jgi:hypothetical protein